MELGVFELGTSFWVATILLIALISWFIFYFSPVVIKTTISFVTFSLIILTASAWVGARTLEMFIREWSEYEISRVKEGAFTFIERRKSEQRNIVRRFSDEPQKIMEDRFAKTILDYIAVADQSGNIIASNRNLTVRLGGVFEDIEQKFYNTEDGVYLITVGQSSQRDRLIIVGEKVEIRHIPALQDMLSVKDVYVRVGESGGAEEDVLRNAEMEIGDGIRLVIVPNYDLIFEIISKLVYGASRGMVISILFAVVFFAVLSVLYIRRPLVWLMRASREVEAGNFEYEVPYRPKGDIGNLIRTFNNMIKGLRRRDSQIKYRNELLSAIKELARAILSEFDKEKIFEICVEVAGVKTSSRCAIFYGDKVKYSEMPENITKDELDGLKDGDVISKNGSFSIFYEIAVQKEDGKVVYGHFVAQRERDFTQEEKEFFISIVNYAASACLRGDYVMKLKLLQSTDSLTGLFNSTFFKASVRREISMLNRFQRNFGIVFIDVENASEIVDKFGNIVWEDILKAIAAVMKKSVRAYDIPARLGNDKFALLLPNTVAQNAKIVEERIREVISSAPEIPSLPEVEMRIKVSSTATDSEPVEEIFRKIEERVTAVR